MATSPFFMSQMAHSGAGVNDEFSPTKAPKMLGKRR
jgi:hypothetical protein